MHSVGQPEQSGAGSMSFDPEREFFELPRKPPRRSPRSGPGAETMVEVVRRMAVPPSCAVEVPSGDGELGDREGA